MNLFFCDSTNKRVTALFLDVTCPKRLFRIWRNGIYDTIYRVERVSRERHFRRRHSTGSSLQGKSTGSIQIEMGTLSVLLFISKHLSQMVYICGISSYEIKTKDNIKNGFFLFFWRV